ncbi:MAG: YqeG family HAD IIIA-type phosphatase [Bacillota bacterium]|jgi:HAD superfamily phosphatase (TIGR01668 family)
MYKNLKPRHCTPSIKELDLAHLKKQGIKAIILDLDNTIVEWGATYVSPELTAWVDKLKENGFKLCILSNGMPSRVHLVAQKLGIPGVPRAIKPRRGAFEKALALLETSCDETAVIGDQLFTDILGGNRCSLYTVLTPPLSKREFIYTRIVRIIEKIVLNHMKRAGILEWTSTQD